MFDYDPSTDELVKPVESFVPEVTPGATKFDKLDPGQLVYAATGHDLDLGKALQQVEEAEKIKESEERMIEAMHKEQKSRQSRAASPTSEAALEPTQPGDFEEPPPKANQGTLMIYISVAALMLALT
ncbi:hypothetical protein OSTOST_10278, partial [Ostertagia ostertagi]